MMYNKLVPTLFTSDMFKRMDELFGELDFFNADTASLTISGHPKGDVFVNKDGNLTLKLALAGYSKEQLAVSVEDNKLTVSATKSEEDGEGQGSLAKRAFKKTFTDFARSWDLDTAEVSYKDGLLKIVAQPLNRKVNVSRNLNIK